MAKRTELSLSQIHVIKVRHMAGETIGDLAREYRVGPTTIRSFTDHTMSTIEERLDPTPGRYSTNPRQRPLDRLDPRSKFEG